MPFLKVIPTIIKFLFLVVIVLAVFVTRLLNGVYVSYMSIFTAIIRIAHV